MSIKHMKKGTFAPIFYFENKEGSIIMMPSDEETRRYRKFLEEKMGYEFKFAETLKQAEDLQKKFNAHLQREQQMELEQDDKMTAQRRQAVRDRLYARMTAAGTPPAERDFIKVYLDYRNNKHDIFRKRMVQQFGVLNALEFDDPDKHVHDLADRV